MMVHLPTSESVTSSPFITPALRRQKVPAAPRATAAASFGPSSDFRSMPSYWPVDSNIIACRVELPYEGDGRLVSSPVELRRQVPKKPHPLPSKVDDIMSSEGSANMPHSLSSEVKDDAREGGSFTENIRAEPAEGDTFVLCTSPSRDYQISMSATAQLPYNSAQPAANTASQLSQVGCVNCR